MPESNDFPVGDEPIVELVEIRPFVDIPVYQGEEPPLPIDLSDYTYTVFRNGLGVVDAIVRRPDGATVPVWDATDPITIAYYAWLGEHPEFDADDHPPAELPVVPPNWETLTNSLRGSALWEKAFGAAMGSIAANAAMTLMLTSLTATHSIQDLHFAFTTLRQVMIATLGLADFSETELDFLRGLLEECGFDPAIVELP